MVGAEVVVRVGVAERVCHDVDHSAERSSGSDRSSAATSRQAPNSRSSNAMFRSILRILRYTRRKRRNRMWRVGRATSELPHIAIDSPLTRLLVPSPLFPSASAPGWRWAQRGSFRRRNFAPALRSFRHQRMDSNGLRCGSLGSVSRQYRAKHCSGTGTVHNAFMRPSPQKAVVETPFRPAPRSFFNGELTLSPKPVFFITNKTAETTTRRLVTFLVRRNPTPLPRILASAMRGEHGGVDAYEL